MDLSMNIIGYCHIMSIVNKGEVAMKKLISILLFAALVISLSACSSNDKYVNSVNSDSSSSTMSTVQSTTSSETVSSTTNSILDSVSMKVIEAKKESVVGDRTAENVGKDNGEYFADGSDIVKAADYENITITIQVDNKSNKAITFSQMGWSAVMPDGSKLDKITVDGDIEGQIPSNYSGTSKILILAKKSLNISSFKLSYNLMDYNDEWNAALSDLMQNGLTEEQFNAKYDNKFVSKKIDFDVKV